MAISRNNLYPVFLKVENFTFLIVGGGNVAEEKLHFLLKSSPGAQIRIVALAASEKVVETSKRNRHVSLEIKAFEEADVTKGTVVIAATNDRVLNERVYRAAKANHRLVNVADTPDLCDFYMGSIVTKGDLKVAISTNGKSPTFAKRFRQILEEVIPDDIQLTLNSLHGLRERLHLSFTDKVRKLNEITSIMITRS